MKNEEYDKKRNRYNSSRITYKTISCRTTEIEYRKITEHCILNNLSKSLFMSAAAMYCLENNIDLEDRYHPIPPPDLEFDDDYNEKEN
ncbi:MAG: hypothetical protein J6A30_07825 [Ruminococcus sp.]|nr:hypothetical protein [Ruminococcus sp.]